MVPKMNLSEIVIAGGGTSIKPYLSVLQPVLAAKCTILINYAYKHFNGTFLCFGDKDFYSPTHGKKRPDLYPDIYEELKQLPLIIGLEKNDGIKEFLLPNTYVINCPKKLPNRPSLTGVFALCIAEFLEPERIFLLGMDWDKRDPKSIPTGKDYNPYSSESIHYYGKNEFDHRGLNYIGYYENHDPDKIFKPFEQSKSKIYNVSLNSNIQNFEKISYEQMFNKMDTSPLNQEELRQYIKEKLCIP
jgi:hypothetical protein